MTESSAFYTLLRPTTLHSGWSLGQHLRKFSLTGWPIQYCFSCISLDSFQLNKQFNKCLLNTYYVKSGIHQIPT